MKSTVPAVVHVHATTARLGDDEIRSGLTGDEVEVRDSWYACSRCVDGEKGRTGCVHRSHVHCHRRCSGRNNVANLAAAIRTKLAEVSTVVDA